MPPLLQVKQTILLTIKRLGINGEGIGYYKKKAVFVPGLIPPEEAIVRITEVQDNYATAEIVHIRIKAAKRVQPFCRHYFQCGGCQTQHIAYDEQLLLKEELLQQTIERYAKLTPKDIVYKDMVGMAHPRHYRHKAQMPVQQTKQGLTTGLYKPGTNDLVPILDCPVHTEAINEVNQRVLDICENHDIRAFDPKSLRGMLRYIVTRQSHKTGEIQVTLVITIFNKVLFAAAKEMLEIDGVVSVAISKNHDKSSGDVFGEEVEILAGKEYIEEGIGDLVFELKPKAFYQLNPAQAVVMYDHLKTLIDPKTDRVLVDAYSGAGAIALYLGGMFETVVGIDSSPESVYSARHNQKKNKMDHVSFELGETHTILPALHQKGIRPDVLVIDPPRSGIDAKTLTFLMNHPVPKILYVSCNPSTLGKNLNTLKRKYQVHQITPFDMFPQTSHVESVVLLTAMQ
jgi:23S rRNA (uracil-5-)-methyltransferase RumA